MAIDRYGELGVDYSVLDSSKRAAIAAARSTSAFMADHGGRVVEDSRGASAFVLELGDETLAFVIEGLGTKSIIAREWLAQTGEDRFADIGVDAVGAIVNDVCSVGALPFVVNAYFATGRSDWHGGGGSLNSLIAGWRDGCEQSGAVWGGGESPALPGLVSDTDIEVAGSCIGRLPKSWRPILGDELADGDRIVLIESSGLHANGASIARSAAAGLADGFRTLLPSGEPFGAALLRPSTIYVPLIKKLSERGVRPTYLSHVTGHGFRKLMRAAAELTYVIDAPPPVPEVLVSLSEFAGLDQRAAYGTFNMGAGFAVYVRPADVDAVVGAAAECGLRALPSGWVQAGKRSVELPTLGITFDGDELDLR
jgi:phosphoribosylformylglycinamidine cyclo-ligase